MRYVSKRPDDAPERALLKELAAERRRFGYRRLREMARRRGVVMNLKKVYRLYEEEGLTVRRRGGRKPNNCCVSGGPPHISARLGLWRSASP